MSTQSPGLQTVATVVIDQMRNTIQKQKEKIEDLEKSAPGDNEALAARNSQLEAELEAMKVALANRPLAESKKKTMGISEGGALYVWVPGRKFPVVLFKEQWLKLLSIEPSMRSYLTEHDSELCLMNSSSLTTGK